MHRGPRTSEFWITALAILGTMFTTLAGIYTGHIAAAMIVASSAMGIAAAAYSISRGMAKKKEGE